MFRKHCRKAAEVNSLLSSVRADGHHDALHDFCGRIRTYSLLNLGYDVNQGVSRLYDDELS